MNKLKNAFYRTKSQEHRRSQQFVKRLSERQSMSLDGREAPPTLALQELLEQERVVFQSWWKDLDPFQRDSVDNETLLKFIGGCGLADSELEQILALFEDARDGLNSSQFYAMLRLIAHAQHGRKISRDLIYLGAHAPQFQTKAINALLKSTVEPEGSHTRNLWWGQQIPSDDPFRSPGPNQEALRTGKQYINLTCSPSQPRQQYTHSRSRSVPFSSHHHEMSGSSTQDVYAFDTIGATPSKQEQVKPSLVSSRSSMDPSTFQLSNRINRGQSLLLTQKFVYEPKSNNPFETDSDVSPFEDSTNCQPNRHSIPPPSVPTQDTKPTNLLHSCPSTTIHAPQQLESLLNL